MTAATDRKEHIILSREIHRPNYVRHVDAAGNQTRLFMDHPIVHLARFVIILVARLDQSAAQVRFEIGNGIFVKHDEVSLKRSYAQDTESRNFHRDQDRYGA